MTVFILIEMAVALVATVAFIVLYATRSPWRGTAMGRHIMAWMVVMAAEIGSLLALGVWRVPAWVYALVFGALDAVVLQRLWLLWRAQRDR